MKRLHVNPVKMHAVFSVVILSILIFGAWSGRFSFFQEVFSAPIRGSGTINQVAAFGTTDTIGNSIIFDDGTNVGIGTTDPSHGLTIETAAGFGNAQNDLALKKGHLRLWGALIDTFGGGDSWYLDLDVGGRIRSLNITDRLHLGPTNSNHLYLGSANNNYGWRIDTHDFGSGSVPFRIFRRTNSVDTEVLTILNQNGNVNFGKNVGLNAGNALYFGKEENFGGSDTGGSDYGYIRWDNDNNSYRFWGDSGENGALVIGAENDGINRNSDVIALKSHAAVVADAPFLITPGAVISGGSLHSRRAVAADDCNSGNLNLWDTENDRGWLITNRRRCENSLNDLKFWFWDSKNWHERVVFFHNGVVGLNGDVHANYLSIRPQDGTHEGGELRLLGAANDAAPDHPAIHFDNYAGNARIHTLAAGKRFEVLGGAGIRVTALASCDTIDTDAAGNFRCGTDAAGSGGVSSEADPVWTGWRDNAARSALSGEITADTVNACRGGSCSHLRWKGDNANYLRGRTYVDADQLEINSGWPDGQRVFINSNQIWKNGLGDSTLYFQSSLDHGAVQIGNGTGAKNNLIVKGDIDNRGNEIYSNRYYDDNPAFWIDSNVDSKMNSVRFTGKIGFSSCNSINCGLWLWDYNDSNHVIYSANPSGAPGGLAGAWDAGHRFRFRTYGDRNSHKDQGFLWENSANQLLMDLDADTGRLYLPDYLDVNDVWIRGAGVWASQLCRSNGTNCPASAGTPNLQQVTVAGKSTDQGLTVTAGEVRQEGGGWLRYFSNSNWQGIHVDNSNITNNTVGIMQNNDGSFHIHRWNQGDILYANSAGTVTALMQGNVGIGVTDPAVRLAIGDHDTGLHWVSDGVLQIYTNGQNRISVANNGHVLIPYTLAVGRDVPQVVVPFNVSKTTGGTGMTSIVTGGSWGTAIDAKSSSPGSIGVQASGSSYDFRAVGSGADYGSFTGAHDVKLAFDFPEMPKSGLIVSVSGETKKITEAGAVSLSTTLPTVTLSTKPNDRAVFGTFISETTWRDENLYKPKPGERFGIVNALGEGRVWVSTINGEPAVGDYLTTSEIPGYGMKQDDDLLHNYTLGKITEKVEWEKVSETVEYNSKQYKIYLIAVVYVSG